MKYLAGVTTLQVAEDRCNGCGMCTIVCPHGVLALKNGSAAVVERDACMECGACARNCPTGAVTVRAGVGCAQAVISSALGRTSGSCCSVDDYSMPGEGRARSDSDCGCEGGPPRQGGSGCC